jgi:hypothetical protein
MASSSLGQHASADDWQRRRILGFVQELGRREG